MPNVVGGPWQRGFAAPLPSTLGAGGFPESSLPCKSYGKVADVSRVFNDKRKKHVALNIKYVCLQGSSSIVGQMYW